MAVLFQAAELEDWPTVVDGTSVGIVSNSTVANTFNSSNARGSVLVGQHGGGTEFYNRAVSAPFSSSEFWVGFNLYFNGSAGGAARWFVLSSGGTRRIALLQTGTSILRADLWTGSAWSAFATAAANTLPANVRTKYDVYVKLGNPGAFRVYKDGIAIIAETPNFSFGGISVLDLLEFCNAGTSFPIYVSEVIVATWNTVSSKLVSRVPDANGFYTAWTNGGFGVLDEHVIGTDYATSGTADQRASYSFTDFPALGAGEVINNVRVNIVASRDGGGPQAINHFARIGTTDYDKSNLTLVAAQGGKTTDFDVSPATSVGWAVAELNAAQFGIRSRA